MRPMEIAEVASAAGGTWLNPRKFAPPARSVTIDSREAEEGSLFVALSGKRDGHDFIDTALNAGAVGCLCQRIPETLRPDKAYIQVPDTRLALGLLASRYREQFHIPIVQITGSVGKTTMKDFIAAVLGEKLKVLKTEGNYNNDLGVPLTLLGLGPQHEAAVIETGMNHFGEIDYLGSLVRPDIAVITNIGDAHIEFLGSRQGILQAKCEIFNHLKEGGLAVLNGDDAMLGELAPPFRTVHCGYREGCQARVVDFFDYSVRGIGCTVKTERDVYRLNVPAPGGHMVWPAAMSVAIGEALGLDREEIVRGAAAYRPSGSRMRVLDCSRNRILLDDCYNANPQSVTAALEVLARTECDKRVAVLGDMGELGDIAMQAHYNVGALTAMLGIDDVVAIGEMAENIYDGSAQNGGEAAWYRTKEEAMGELYRQWEPGTAMLVKASHAMGFDWIVKEVLRWSAEQA